MSAEATSDVVEVLRDELAQANSLLEQIESERDALRSAVALSKAEVQRLEGWIRSQSEFELSDVKRARSTAARLQEELDSVHQRVRDLERQVETEADEYAEVSALLEETRAALSSSEARVKELEKKQEELSGEVARALEECATVTKAAGVAREATLKRLDQAETRCQATLEERDRLRQEKSEREERMAALERELNELRERFRAIVMTKMSADGAEKSTMIIRLEHAEDGPSDQ